MYWLEWNCCEYKGEQSRYSIFIYFLKIQQPIHPANNMRAPPYNLSCRASDRVPRPSLPQQPIRDTQESWNIGRCGGGCGKLAIWESHVGSYRLRSICFELTFRVERRWSVLFNKVLLNEASCRVPVLILLNSPHVCPNLVTRVCYGGIWHSLIGV